LVKGSLVLGTVCEINPLGIVVALPNNLTGRVQITSISEALTERLQASAAKDEEADDSSDEADDDVDLKSMFQLGQYVRAYVLSTISESTVGKSKHQIELSLMPVHANAGMSQQDVVANCTVMASVASVEDHGFVMDINLADSKLRGFLSKKQVDKSIPEGSLRLGGVLLCIALGNSSNGKVVQLSTLTDRIGSPKNSIGQG
jgi:rRNA biogenesis protein RRP5